MIIIQINYIILVFNKLTCFQIKQYNNLLDNGNIQYSNNKYNQYMIKMVI